MYPVSSVTYVPGLYHSTANGEPYRISSAACTVVSWSPPKSTTAINTYDPRGSFGIATRRWRVAPTSTVASSRRAVLTSESFVNCTRGA